MLNRCISSVILRLVSLIARWLNKPLHDYVSFNRDTPFFIVGFTGFTVKFEELRLLRKGWNALLLKFGFPLQLHTVVIESLSLHCGVWSPITIEASGVYFLLNPTTEKYYDYEAEIKNNLLTKRNRLKNLDFDNKVFQKQSRICGHLSNLANFFFSSLLKRIEISIKNVHVKLEDDLSIVGEPVVTGVALESFSVTKKQAKKQVEISQLSVYCNCRKNSELLYHSSESSAVIEKLQSFPFQDALGYDYVLRPIALSGELQLTRGKTSLLEIGLSVQCPALKLQVSKEQLKALLKCLSFIKQQEHFRCFHKFRTSSRPVGKENAREWWKFALRSVCEYVKGKNGRKVWDQLLTHKSLNVEYSRLYEKSITEKNPGKRIRIRLQTLEDKMELLQIMVCRSKVWKNLKLRRIFDDLSSYVHCKETRIKSKELEGRKMTFLSLSLACKFTDVQLKVTEHSHDENLQDNTILKWKGRGIHVDVSHQLLSFRIAVTVHSFDLTGSSASNDKNASGPSLLHQANFSTANIKPVVHVEYTANHDKSHSGKNSFFDYHVEAYLEQTVFIFDKRTSLKVTELFTSLIESSDNKLRLALREQAHDLAYKGKRRVKSVVNNYEVISVNAAVQLPLIVLPSSSESCSATLVVRLGHFKVLTSIEDKTSDQCLVSYDANVSGTSLALTSLVTSESGWDKLFSADSDGSVSTRLLNCPDVKLKLSTMILLSNGFCSSPMMHVDGKISSVEFVLSDHILETCVLAVSQHMKTCLELKEIVECAKREDNEHLYSHVSDTVLTDSRLMEVVQRIHEHSTPISKQFLHNQVTEAVDGKSNVVQLGSDSVTLDVVFVLNKLSVELSAGSHLLDNFLGVSIERIRVKLKQSEESTECALKVSSVSIVDSSIDEKGAAIKPVVPIITTQSNFFLLFNICMADPSMSLPFKAKYKSVKDDIVADFGSLAFSLSDASLFTWTRIFIKLYQKAAAIDIERLMSQVCQQKSTKPKRALQLSRQEVSNGVIALNSSVSFKEIAFSLVSGTTVITKLYLSGIKGEIKDSIICTECAGSVDSLVLLDSLHIDGTRSKLISSNISEKVLKFMCTLKKSLPYDKPRVIISSHSRPTIDVEDISSNLRADVTVGGVSCVLLLKYIATLQRYFQSIINMSKDLMLLRNSIPKKPADTAPFKCNLSVNVHTLSFTIPEKVDSANAVEVKLESLLVSNKYISIELSGAGGEEYHPITEIMQLDFHLLSVSRQDEEEFFKLLSIPDLGISFSRIISSGIPLQALQLEPQFKVIVGAEVLEIYASNQDINALLLIFQGHVEEAASVSLEIGQTPASGISAIGSFEQPGSVMASDSSADVVTEEKGANLRIVATSLADTDPVVNEGPTREMLQLDVNLRSLSWTISYIEPRKNSSLLQSVPTVMTELLIKDILMIFDLKPDGCISSDVWVMDLTLKENPSDGAHSNANTAYIICHSLYYKKTKPPRLGSWTMDTRRSSPKDALLQVSFSYSEQDINVSVIAQHIHVCLWPCLIHPFIKHGDSSDTDKPREKVEKITAVKRPRTELNVKLNNLSLSLLDRPSNSTSCGICVEIVSPSNETSSLKIIASSSEMTFFANPIYFEACLMQFGQKAIKLLQVVDPCSIKTLYSLKRSQMFEPEEEIIEISVSPIIITLSMEVVYSIRKPISKAFNNEMITSSNVEEHSAMEDIWATKKIDGKVYMREEVIESTRVDSTAITHKVQRAELHLPDVMIHFDVIISGNSNSMVSLTTMVEAKATSWSSDVTADAHIELSGFIFNQRVAAWEPLLEPLYNPVHDTYRRWKLIAKVRHIAANSTANLTSRGSISSIGSADMDKFSRTSRITSASEALESVVSPLLTDDSREFSLEDIDLISSNDSDSVHDDVWMRNGGSEQRSVVVILTSNDRVEVTLSPGVVDTIFRIIEASNQEDSEMERNLVGCSYFNVSPMLVKNETGLQISVYPGPTFEIGNSLFSHQINLPGKRSSETTTCTNILNSTTDVPITLTSVAKPIPELEADPKNDKSVEVLRYVNADSKHYKETYQSGRVEDTDSNEIEQDILEELDGCFSPDGLVPAESSDKMNSLTKLRDYLKDKRQGSAQTKQPSLEGVTNWMPRALHHRICIQAKGGKKSRPISVSLPGCIPIPLHHPSFGGLGHGRKMVGICEVENVHGTRVVTIRSPIQIKNDFPMTVTLYEHSEFGTTSLAEVEPNKTYNLSMSVFAEKTPLKIGIGHNGLFDEGILDWSALIVKMQNPVYLSCPAKLSLHQKFYLQVTASVQSGVTQVGLYNKPFHIITLKPAFTVHNLLPMTVQLHVPAEKSRLLSSPKHEGSSVQDPDSQVFLAPGEIKNILCIDPTKEQKFSLEIPSFRGMKWRGLLTSDPHTMHDNRHSQVKFHAYNDKGEQVAKMKLGVYCNKSSPSLYHLYCPYWVCNKTGMKLEYEYHSSSKLHKSVRIFDDGKENSITLIYFKHSVENKDKKLKIRLAQQGQSYKTISLGNTGQAGNISIKAKNGTLYELSVQNRFSSHNILTQVVNIFPKYIVYNQTKVKLRLNGYSRATSEPTEEHVILNPNEVKTYWPSSHKVSVILMQDESGLWTHTTKPFLLTKIGTLALITDHKLMAVTVRISPDETGSFILVTIGPYTKGTALYQIENMTNKLTVKFSQSGSAEEIVIPPGHFKLYAWDNFLQDDLQLQWQVVGELQDKWTSVKDKFVGARRVILDSAMEKSESPRSSVIVYWRITYNGSQKVLQLFDSMQSFEQSAQKSYYPSALLSRVALDNGQLKSNLQVFCSMEGIGVSILNDRPVEVIYCSVISSPAVWLKRSRDGGKLRALDEEHLMQVEATWRSGMKEIKIESELFNLDKLKGNHGGSLVRCFNPGFWVWCLVSDDYFMINVKLGRLQIDNQLRDYALDNRIILAPERNQDPEMMVSPIVDVAMIVRRPNSKQQVTVFEDAYVKIRNMQVNVEMGVVAALFPFIESFLSRTENEMFSFDNESVLMSLDSIIELEKESHLASKTCFQSLVISPVKISVTYTTIIAGPYSMSNVLGNVLDSILHLSSFIANGTITIKLDLLKFTSDTVSVVQLSKVIFGHYKNEILSQIHSVVFGLDLIGNPSKVIHNFESGVKDLIEESEKGFERNATVHGVAVGVKELLGHIIEGSTESLGSTTGSFRNTLLETTDVDYRRRHRLLEHATPKTLGANLLVGTSFFVEGLIGVTDIFTKPFTGATRGGARGFFHGLGRGALSILTKPTLGVLDLAYFTLEGIRSLADDDWEAQSVRLPRLIRSNKVVTPYSTHEAEGLYILWHNPESKETEYYGHHWLPTDTGKEPRVLLINSLNILRLKKDSKRFKVDDLNIKLEYLQQWGVHTEKEDAATIYIKYGEDSRIEKIGSFLGISKPDHNAEVVDLSTIVNVDSLITAKYLVNRITEACEEMLFFKAGLSTAST